MKQTNGSELLERVSALADGQLEGDEFARAVDELGSGAELRASWQVYHLVGEVLRTGAHAPCTDSGVFMARLQQRLAAESVARPVASAVPVASLPQVAEAANEPVFRWKMVAGVATIAAAAAIGWTWMGQGPAPATTGGAQLALQTPQAPVGVEAAVPGGASGQGSILAAAATAGGAAPLSRTRVLVGNGAPQVMLRNPRLDELLEAHQQASGASQMPSGFLRNATFESPSR
ncbi:MAG: sigma-E factor negative regulatory protein [Rhodocyclaceae bacterium]|nr:sigma-E factor negative regulatory protein [Rhodocyclaceae bacterium]MDQ7999660.1 sigma-E factor negative regulatory protein [Pseudomonadota bacterium]MDQ8016429.1 sigma-E factor negative regulatory protein [Pseudomonadota bacterium]